jgi:glycosyltransferase involved in cell wall biosynthesis
VDIFFSVIIPAYNAEQYLGEAIESALQQEGVNLEVIVVDDGSTDGSCAVAERFGKNVTIVSQKNMGISAARNSGAKAAQGNVLAFLDADDVWLPGKLKSQDLKLQQGYPIVYTDRYNIGEIGDLPEIQSQVYEMPEGDIWFDLLLGNMITTSSSVIRKELFTTIGGFQNDLRYCEDWDLWLRCAERNKIGFCPEPLVKYRLHSGGLSKNYMFMSETRERIMSRALTSERGKELSFIVRRRVVSRFWTTSGWDAARAKDLPQSLKFYSVALRTWPFSSSLWYDIARSIAGRA